MKDVIADPLLGCDGGGCGDPAASRSAAQNIGSMFFNILHLDCFEPVYPKVCVEATFMSRVNRFFSLDIFKQNNSTSAARQRNEGCIQWEEDLDASPIDIKFLKLKRSF